MTTEIVSLFESHSDVIVKGKRDVEYGDKINVATQVEGFVSHLNIEKGNPGDKILYMPVLQACHKHYAQLPDSVVANGGYSSQANVEQARALGMKRVVFNKRVDLGYHQRGVKKKSIDALNNFRAGIEGNISELKSAFAMG